MGSHTQSMVAELQPQVCWASHTKDVLGSGLPLPPPALFRPRISLPTCQSVTGALYSLPSAGCFPFLQPEHLLTGAGGSGGHWECVSRVYASFGPAVPSLPQRHPRLQAGWAVCGSLSCRSIKECAADCGAPVSVSMPLNRHSICSG